MKPNEALQNKSKSITNLNENEKSFSERITYLELENNVQKFIHSPYRTPLERYNFQQADEVSNFNEEKTFDPAVLQIKQMGALKYLNRYPNFGLSPSKSLPEIPKTANNTFSVAEANKAQKTAIPRSLGLSRKYVGPVRYPVTPAKDTVKQTTPPLKANSLSLFTESSNDQVFIWKFTRHIVLRDFVDVAIDGTFRKQELQVS